MASVMAVSASCWLRRFRATYPGGAIVPKEGASMRGKRGGRRRLPVAAMTGGIGGRRHEADIRLAYYAAYMSPSLWRAACSADSAA